MAGISNGVGGRGFLIEFREFLAQLMWMLSSLFSFSTLKSSLTLILRMVFLRTIRQSKQVYITKSVYIYISCIQIILPQIIVPDF